MKRVTQSTILVAVLAMSASMAFAREPAGKPEAVPEPPEIPPALMDGEAIEPEVTIIKKEEGTIYEYRINGQLYMVKVQPIVGPAYYLVDRDGDGEFDAREGDPEKLSVPQWILLRW